MLFVILLLYTIDMVMLTVFLVQIGNAGELSADWWFYSYVKTILAALTTFFLRGYLKDFATKPEVFSNRQTGFLFTAFTCLATHAIFDSFLGISAEQNGITAFEVIPPFLFSELGGPGSINLKNVALAVFIMCTAFILRYVSALRQDSNSLA